MKVLKIVLHTSKTVDGKGYGKISTKGYPFSILKPNGSNPGKILCCKGSHVFLLPPRASRARYYLQCFHYWSQ